MDGNVAAPYTPRASRGDTTALDTSPSLAQLRESSVPEGLPLTVALNSVLQKLWQVPGAEGGGRRRLSNPINPQNLLNALARKNEDYDGTSQQDAHEVLLCLLDSMRLEEVDASCSL